MENDAGLEVCRVSLLCVRMCVCVCGGKRLREIMC